MTTDHFKLLNKINKPSDLRALPPEDLEKTCEQLRCFLIDTLSETPGHFGASLGVVELTVALHYVFNTPVDKLVWDVGHQAYGTKYLPDAVNNLKHSGNTKDLADSRHPRRVNTMYLA